MADQKESESFTSRKSSVKKNSSDNEMRLKAKVEEFKLWTDEKQFLQLEYDRRRERKKELKGTQMLCKFLFHISIYLQYFIMIWYGYTWENKCS